MLFLGATTNDILAALILTTAGLLSESRLAPWGLRMHTDRLTTLSSSVWMIHWVHRTTTDMRTTVLPTASSSLTDTLCTVFKVTDLTERRVAFLANQTNFSRSQFDLSHRSIKSHED